MGASLPPPDLGSDSVNTGERSQTRAAAEQTQQMWLLADLRLVWLTKGGSWVGRAPSHAWVRRGNPVM